LTDGDPKLMVAFCWEGRKWGRALKVIRSFAIYTVALVILTPFAGGSVSSARADDADLAQVLGKLKELESRVATLESEKQQYRREAASARAETQALKQKLGHHPGPAVPLQLPPPDIDARVTRTPKLAAVPTWGGLYAGASFGLASQHVNQAGVESDATTATTSSVVGAGFSDTSSSSEALTNNAGGRGLGAMANLYIGYDYLLPSNFLVGAEIEGGISNSSTTLNDLASGPSQSVSTLNSGGIITTTPSTGSSTENMLAELDSHWTMSALVRGGLVVDPKDLVYLVGGLSYARFEFDDAVGFGAFGGTVGAGWERKITPSWTLKAEYRYTRFQDRTVTQSSNATVSSSGGGSSASSSDAIVETSRLSGLDWQTVSIGVSHYFDAN
jgi:outer membrane immunogenic protein